MPIFLTFLHFLQCQKCFSIFLNSQLDPSLDPVSQGGEKLNLTFLRRAGVYLSAIWWVLPVVLQVF